MKPSLWTGQNVPLFTAFFSPALLAVFLVTGCTTQMEEHTPATGANGSDMPLETAAPGDEPATAAPGSDELPPYVIVPVFYATDRKPVMDLQDWRRLREERRSTVEYYGPEWRNNLELGVCHVSIPTQVHETGEIERPRFFQSESVEKHFVILTLRPTPEEEFFGKVQDQVARSSEQDAFVFIHGYNVKFADAIMRTAQIAFDVGFQGAPVLYSWPSAGETGLYLKDEETIDLTVDHLKGFLDQLISQVRPAKLHLVAHSMGNRALTRVLQTFQEAHPEPVFNEIILAAPDVNRVVFLERILPGISGTGKRITLYASSDDVPLQVSRRFHDYPRAGEGPPHLVLVDGVETIDASGINTDFLAHSYFAQARPVIQDIADVVLKGYPPARRRLEKVTGADGTAYWAIPRPGR